MLETKIIMNLKAETIKELGQIIFEEYGIQLVPEKVSELARDLTGYFDLLALINHQQN